MHIIAAKAVCFGLAMEEEFRAYIGQVLANARVLSRRLIERGYEVVSGGTDTHLFLLDLSAKGFSGKKAERWLEAAAITVNKNTVPFDERKPWITSGVRIGTPAVTTRGMGPPEMEEIAHLIGRVVADPKGEGTRDAVRGDVERLCRRFPLYGLGEV